MELGTLNLKEFLNNNPNYFKNYENLKSFIFQILNGLNYLSENSLVHRDLKIENILFFENQNLFKISDLGSCVEIIKNDRRQHRGYIIYAPPEIRFNKIYNYHKTDIFSFGLVILQCIGILNDPNDLTQYKNEKDFNFKKNELLEIVEQIFPQSALLNFLGKILEYKIIDRLTPKEAGLILNKEFTPDEKPIIPCGNLLKSKIYLKNENSYLSIIEDELLITDSKETEFELIKTEKAKFLIKYFDTYLSSSIVNQSKVILSDKKEEWGIIMYEPQGVYFIKNINNNLFLSVNGENIGLNGILSNSEKFKIE
jgi:serine/threonine protein kinase